MKSVLTSIQPPFTDTIFCGLKDIEWRTKPLPTGKHHCYETKNGGGVGKVIGEFHIAHNKRYDNISDIPEAIIRLGCVSREFLQKYSNGRPLYANFITRRKRYETPRELSEFSKYGFSHPVWLKRPPQSYCYVESEVQGK